MNFFDLSLIGVLNSLAGKNEWLDAVIIFSAIWLGWWMVAGVLSLVAVPLVRKTGSLAGQTKKVLAVFGSALIARYGIVEAIRFFYDRARPFEVLSDIYQLILHAPGGSFPSGHAAFSFALATGVFFYYPKTSVLFFIGAAAVSLARVAAGLHWTGDVAAGAFAGVATTLLVMRLFPAKRNL